MSKEEPTIAERVQKIYILLLNNYSSSMDMHANVSRALADLRHLCDNQDIHVESVFDESLVRYCAELDAEATPAPDELELKCPSCDSTEFHTFEREDDGNGTLTDEMMCSNCNAEVRATYAEILTKVEKIK